MEKVGKIEDRVNGLKEELGRQKNHLSELRKAVKTTLANISAIEGALQAYLESIRIMKEPEQELQAVSEK